MPNMPRYRPDSYFWQPEKATNAQVKQLSRLEVMVSYTKPYLDNLLPENTFFTTTWGKTINSIQQHINSSAALQKAHVEAAPAPSSSHGTAREAGAPLCCGTGTLQAAVESQGHLCVLELHPAREASKEQLWHQALPENGSHLKDAPQLHWSSEESSISEQIRCFMGDTQLSRF